MVNEQHEEEKTLENQEFTSATGDEVESANPEENQSPEAPDLLGEVTEGTPVSLEFPDSVEETATADEQEAIIASLQAEIASLAEKVSTQKEQAESYKAQYMRIAADFDNFRKRTQKEKEDLRYQVKRDTITELLTVVDNFERARTQIKPENDGEMAIHKSYQGVYKNLVDSLKKIGVSAMKAEGQPFDPNYHEAMLREATNEYPEDTVIEQLMRGYLLEDRVLRHAMVKVAVPGEPVVTSEETNAESDTSEASENN